MKKYVLYCITLILAFSVNILKTNATLIVNNDSSYVPASITISDDYSTYQFDNYLETIVPRPSAEERKQIVLPNVKNDVYNGSYLQYEDTIREWMRKYYKTNLYYHNLKTNRKQFIMPAELAINAYTGYPGTREYVEQQIENSKTNEYQIGYAYFKNDVRSFYPLRLDQVISIFRAESNTWDPIIFNKNINEYPLRITDNGNLDEHGFYVSENTLKVTTSELSSGQIMLVSKTLSPFTGYHTFFSSNGKIFERYQSIETRYQELNGCNGLEGNALNTCLIDPDLYLKTYNYNVPENERKFKREIGKVYNVPIVKDENGQYAIYGMYYTEMGTLSESEPTGVLAKEANCSSLGISYVYEFKVPIEVVPDDYFDEEVSTNSKESFVDNNAVINIKNEGDTEFLKYQIENKKQIDYSRIYIKLNDVCDSINNCSIEEKQDDEGKTYYQIKRLIGENNVVFSVIHYPETREFTTSIYSTENEQLGDVLIPEEGYVDAESIYENDELYVPIRFIVNALGANVAYQQGSEDKSEEVYIDFNTKSDDIEIVSEDMEEDDEISESDTGAYQNYDKIVLKTNTEKPSFYATMSSTKISSYLFGLNNKWFSKSLEDNEEYSLHQLELSNEKTNYLLINKTNKDGYDYYIYKVLQVLKTDEDNE